MSSTSEVGQDAACLERVDHFKISCESVASIAAVLDLAWGLCSGLPGRHLFEPQAPLALDKVVGIGFVNSLVFVLVGASLGVYSLPSLAAPRRIASKLMLAWFVALLLVSSTLFALRQPGPILSGELAASAVIFGAFVASSRILAGRILRRADVEARILGRSALIVGDATGLARLDSRKLLIEHGLRETGRISLPDAENHSPSGGAAQAAATAVHLARLRQVEEIALAVAWRNLAVVESVAEQLRASPLPVRLLPDPFLESVVERRRGGGPFPVSVQLQRAPLSRAERLIKRALDFSVALFALVALAPLLAATAMAIRLDSRGPAIFRQRRAGFDGRPFTIYKFRTMNVVEDGAHIPQAKRNDARVTRIGGCLRRSSIDELPQLLNVLAGEMSLIGPRPHALAHDHHYSGLLAEYAIRRNVKPGISGWAQVNGSRGETAEIADMRRRVELDLWYIDNWSLLIDCLIVVRTFTSLLSLDAY